jgi:hypothetical protein
VRRTQENWTENSSGRRRVLCGDTPFVFRARKADSYPCLALETTRREGKLTMRGCPISTSSKHVRSRLCHISPMLTAHWTQTIRRQMKRPWRIGVSLQSNLGRAVDRIELTSNQAELRRWSCRWKTKCRMSILNESSSGIAVDVQQRLNCALP